MDLETAGIWDTGTLKATRQGVRSEVKQLQTTSKSSAVPRGTGLYASAVFVLLRNSSFSSSLSDENSESSAIIVRKEDGVRVEEAVGGVQCLQLLW